MDIKRRFQLIERVAKILQVEFTDIQLEFLLEETDFRSVCYKMPRVTGKDYITKIKIVIRMLEELENGNRFNMGIVCPSSVACNSLASQTVDLLAKLLPISDVRKMRYESSGRQILIELYSMKIFFFKAEGLTNHDYTHGVRLNEAIVNEFNYYNLGDIIDYLKTSLIDEEGPLFLIGTPNRASITQSIVNQSLEERNFEIKTPDNYESSLTDEESFEREYASLWIDSDSITRGPIFGDNIGGLNLRDAMTIHNTGVLQPNATFTFTATSSNLN